MEIEKRYVYVLLISYIRCRDTLERCHFFFDKTMGMHTTAISNEKANSK